MVGYFLSWSHLLRVSHSDVFGNFRTGHDMLDERHRVKVRTCMRSGSVRLTASSPFEAMDPRSRIDQGIAEFDALPPARAASHGHIWFHASFAALRRRQP